LKGKGTRLGVGTGACPWGEREKTKRGNKKRERRTDPEDRRPESERRQWKEGKSDRKKETIKILSAKANSLSRGERREQWPKGMKNRKKRVMGEGGTPRRIKKKTKKERSALSKALEMGNVRKKCCPEHFHRGKAGEEKKIRYRGYGETGVGGFWLLRTHEREWHREGRGRKVKGGITEFHPLHYRRKSRGGNRGIRRFHTKNDAKRGGKIKKDGGKGRR